MIKLRNNIMGKFKLPNGVRIGRGQILEVPHSVISSGKISKLIATGKMSIVKEEATIEVPKTRPKKDTTPADPAPPPVPAPEPTPAPKPVKAELKSAPEPEEATESKPILKRRGRPKRARPSV